MFHPRIRAAAKPIITNTPQDYERQLHEQRLCQTPTQNCTTGASFAQAGGGLECVSPQREGKSPVLPKHRTISPGDGAFLRSAKIFTAGVLLRFPRQLLFHLLPPHGLPTPLPCGFFRPSPL